jgi:hypothetical protein
VPHDAFDDDDAGVPMPYCLGCGDAGTHLRLVTRLEEDDVTRLCFACAHTAPPHDTDGRAFCDAEGAAAQFNHSRGALLGEAAVKRYANKNNGGRSGWTPGRRPWDTD